MKRKNRKERILAIILGSLLLLGVFCLLWLKYFKESSPVAIKWSTYTDSKYGYSIKYPNNWYLRKDGDTVSIENTSKPLYWDSGVGPKDPNAVAEEGYSIKIFVYNNDNNVSLAEYLKVAIPSENFVMQPITIGGLEAVEAHEKDAWIMFLPDYFLAHSNYIYEIGCGDKSNGLNGLQDIAKQIVQSFNFTKQVVSSDVNQWPQYTNVNFHYSIKYPSQWEVAEQYDKNCVPNDNSPCSDYTFLRATSTTPIQVVVFFNKKDLNLVDWVADKGNDTRKCETVEINNLPGLKCDVSYYFKGSEYVYMAGGINPDYFAGDYRNNQQQEFIDEMEKVIPANELPANFYSTEMTDKQLLLLEEKIVSKIVSTFKIEEK